LAHFVVIKVRGTEFLFQLQIAFKMMCNVEWSNKLQLLSIVI